MGIGTLLFLLFVVAIISAMSKWATDQRYKRKFDERIKEMEECCGEGCCKHEKKGKKIK